ncbi:MAG: P-II family nitrogen regulator [Deltaproteobacteria bacterium]|jgi:nitrogen regulatory protein PII|nr:P-II family nitrogen regulator [Deltaproteobacteria bacterium]
MCQTYELVVAIVKRGLGEKAVASAVQAGAKGATLLSGRGSGTASVLKVYGLAMEIEKDVVLIATPAELSRNVADAIDRVAEVEKPGNGLILVLPVKTGIGLDKFIPETPA